MRGGAGGGALPIAAAALALATAVHASGCLFPDYTFGEGAAGGGGAASSGTATTSSTVGSGGGGGDATTSTTSTMTTTTSTTTSSAGGGEATTSTTGGGPEDCLNGIDDDGDQLVDCADDDCAAGFSCADPIPAGWEALGYLALARSLPGEERACPATFPNTAYLGNDGLVTPPAQCAPCSCGAATNEQCQLPDLETVDPQFPGVSVVRISNKACGLNPTFVGYQDVNANWSGACAGAFGYQGGQFCSGSACNTSVSSGPTLVAGGSCAPAGGDADVDPATWGFAGKACGGAAEGAGCAGGGSCVAKPGVGFEADVCIARAGDYACPAPFLARSVYYDPAQTADDRGCTDCSCGAPSGGTCSVTVQVFKDYQVGQCNNQIGVFTSDDTTGGCVNLANNPIVGNVKMVVGSQTPGSCSVAPSGGQPQGAATEGGATTFCCL